MTKDEELFIHTNLSLVTFLWLLTFVRYSLSLKRFIFAPGTQGVTNISLENVMWYKIGTYLVVYCDDFTFF